MPAFDDLYKKLFEQTNFPNPLDPNGFGHFIQDQMGYAIPDNMKTILQSGPSAVGFGSTTHGQINRQSDQVDQQELNYQAFETHDEFIIRVAILDDPVFQPQKMVLNALQVSFFNEKRKRPLLNVQLAQPVEPNTVKVEWREGILEVILPKAPDEPMIAVDLTELYKASEPLIMDLPDESPESTREG